MFILHISAPILRFSSTVPSNITGIWKTIPTLFLNSPGSYSLMSFPLKKILPVSGSYNLLSSLKSELLPAPDGPNMENISPFSTVKLIFFRRVFPPLFSDTLSSEKMVIYQSSSG